MDRGNVEVVRKRLHLTLAAQFPRSPHRAAKPERFLAYRKDHSSLLIACVNMFVAPDPESMVQKTGGDDDFPPWLDLIDSKGKNPIALSFPTPGYANP